MISVYFLYFIATELVNPLILKNVYLSTDVSSCEPAGINNQSAAIDS